MYYIIELGLSTMEIIPKKYVIEVKDYISKLKKGHKIVAVIKGKWINKGVFL
jgi:hypothetical protein